MTPLPPCHTLPSVVCLGKSQEKDFPVDNVVGEVSLLDGELDVGCTGDEHPGEPVEGSDVCRGEGGGGLQEPHSVQAGGVLRDPRYGHPSSFHPSRTGRRCGTRWKSWKSPN